MKPAVLQIIPNLGAGGAEQSCVDMVEGLTSNGYPAFVVSAGGRRVEEVERHNGLHFQKNVKSKNPFVIIKNAFWLAQFIRRKHIGIVHARSRAPAWSAWIACRITGTLYVTTFHAAYKFSNPLKKFYNRVMARGDKIIAISQFIKDHIVMAYGVDPAKIHVVYRGLDTSKFSPEDVTETRKAVLRQAWGIKEGQRIVLMPARLSPIKGHKLFIEAMALLFTSPLEREEIIGIIMGDDQGREAYRLELTEHILSKGLIDKVKMVDHTSDMPAAYSLADVVVAPSLVPEGFGRVPVEAMAMGVPVIASGLGATVETVQDGVTGWRLPPENPQAWAQAIQRTLLMSADERAAMAQTSQKGAREKFSRQKMIDDTMAVYETLLGRPQ